jgi:hypothetical protein
LRWGTVTQGEKENVTANERDDFIETFPVLLVSMEEGRDDDDDDDDDKEEAMGVTAAAVMAKGVVIPLQANQV